MRFSGRCTTPDPLESPRDMVQALAQAAEQVPPPRGQKVCEMGLPPFKMPQVPFYKYRKYT